MQASMPSEERVKLINYMETNDFVRAKELREIGISSRSISLATEEGLISRESRGLYMANNVEPDTYIRFAEIAKRYPNYPICLLSALSFYNVTVELPRITWIAIGAKSRDPKKTNSRIETVRFREPFFSGDRTFYKINGVNVPVYSLEKCIADAFRNPKLVDRSVAIEVLSNTLTERKSTLSEIVETAKKYKAFNQMRPIVEVITRNG